MATKDLTITVDQDAIPVISLIKFAAQHGMKLRWRSKDHLALVPDESKTSKAPRRHLCAVPTLTDIVGPSKIQSAINSLPQMIVEELPDGAA